MNDKKHNNKELALLRNAVNDASDALGKKIIQSENITSIIAILEKFLKNNSTLCYGGTAINNILPEQDRFYDRNTEIPDYDFFTPNAITCAKKLADIYYLAGYEEVEAKAGIHTGTYKVYVNFIPIADITYIDKKTFTNLMKQSIKINGIDYCPPNFLRMAMYLELSRPMGDVSRWEKVLKRLVLLNKHHPLSGSDCTEVKTISKYKGPEKNNNNIYNIIKSSVVSQGLVFFGGYASALYGRYMSSKKKAKIINIPSFDILSTDAESSAIIIKEQLIHAGYDNITVNKRPSIGELILTHYEIMITYNNKTHALCYIYNASSCHSYNNITIDGEKLKIASIDTILSFYLVFIFVDRPYYDVNRLLCMSEYLFKVQMNNRLENNGLLKRFSINCYGTHVSLEDTRALKSKTYKSLRENKCLRGCKKYDAAFLRYIPSTEKKLENLGNKKNTMTKKQSISLSKMKSRNRSNKYKR
tara:strand:- start:3031 stop:4446 length:1416 start_codon:yes stop_codon:yes gene_type:complete